MKHKPFVLPARRYTRIFLAKAILHVEKRAAAERRRRAVRRAQREQRDRAAAAASATLSTLSTLAALGGGGGATQGVGAASTPGGGAGGSGFRAGTDGGQNPNPDAGVTDQLSGTYFCEAPHLFFPAMVAALIPGGGVGVGVGGGGEGFQGSGMPSPGHGGGGASGSEGQGERQLRRSFHYLLRDFCITLLEGWGRVFEQRQGQQGRQTRLAHAEIEEAVRKLMLHLLAVSDSSASEVRLKREK